MAESSSAAGRRKRSRREPSQFQYREEDANPEILADADDIPDLEDHPLLSFADGTPAQANLRRIINLEPHQPRSIDWTLINELGIRGRLEELLDERWRRVISAEGPQYTVLTLEFFSTLEHRLGTLDDPYAIVFSLGRQLRHMSISEFAVRMGLYTEEEVRLPIFTESLRGIFRTESQFGVTSIQLATFWTTIADGQFVSSTPASQIRDPLYRFLHRVIACTIIARFMGIEKVNTQDLFILYCLIERRPANLATIMLSSLTRQRGRGEGARLAMGTYVARLAENLGVLNTWPARILYEGPSVSRIAFSDMQLMGVCALHGPRRLVDARVPQPMPIPPGAVADDIRPISQRFPQQPRPRAQPRQAGPSSTADPEPSTDIIAQIRADQAALRLGQDQIREELAAQRVLLETILSRLPAPP